MATTYNDNGLKKGRKLKSGKGMAEMMHICNLEGWSDENTILEVNNTSRFDSSWTIYEGIKQKEK